MTSQTRCGARHARRCQAEFLERRVVLSPITVTNTPIVVTSTLDTGTGTLRDAISTANMTQGADTITFAPLFSSSPHTITFTTATPQINDQLTIIGPGASLLTVTRSGTVTASSQVFNSFATSLTMSGMTVTGGNIAGAGGGLSISGPKPDVTLDSMVFTGNTASGNGGAIALTNNATLTVRNTTISGNTAGALGGGIEFVQGGSLVVQNCTISGNTANGVSGHDESGGGIYFDGAALAAPPAWYAASTLLVQASTFNNNTASHGGGAIAVDEFTGTLLLQNSTLFSNSAGTSGGGVLCIGNTATVGSVSLQDCTVVGNTANGTAAGTGGGGVARLGNFTGSITLTGTIVSGNANFALGVNDDVFASSSFTTTNANFCDIGSTRGFTLSGSSGNNLPLGTFPGPGMFGDNGGPTETYALAPSSAEINAGTPIAGITTDQRGVPRPQGLAPDIGAFERQATAATLSSMSYEYLTRQAITFNFTDDASVTFSRSSYTLLDRTTNQTVPSSTGALGFDFTGTPATLVLTDLLADGNYRVTSGTMTLDFFVLGGDANHDRAVDTLDFNALASNFGGTGKNYSQADFNYDGKVDTLDFNTLAGNFGKALPPAMQLAVATANAGLARDLLSSGRLIDEITS